MTGVRSFHFRLVPIALVVLVFAAGSVEAQTTNVKQRASQAGINSDWMSPPIDGSGNVINFYASTDVLDGVASSSANVGVWGPTCNVSGWGGTSTEAFVVSNGGTSGSGTIDIPGVDYNTWTSGTITLTVNATASNAAGPSIVQGIIRDPSGVTQRIHYSLYTGAIDGGTVDVAFNGVPCSSAAIPAGDIQSLDIRVGIQTK